MRVLIVEDDMLVGMLIEDMLTTMGHVPVGPAVSVVDAMALIPDCDFAILDVHLKDGESFPIADVLKELGIPFCFASGSCGEQLEAATLLKPFKREDLQEVMARVLS